MKKDPNPQNAISRREILKRGTVASLGVALTALPSQETAQAATTLKGLAAAYDQYDALGLAELIAKKQITPLELLHAVRERAAAINPKINAICYEFFDKAEAYIQQGLPQGIFRGVPFAVKDLRAEYAGTPMASGSRAFRNYVSSQDSTLVSRYKQAGLVIFAKTATPELGLTTTTESVVYGKTRNPWNLERIAGGSSGGAAAVVGSRILPIAHASDGGGSIRIPASCCGVFGLKPTRGRVQLGPVSLEGWGGMTVQHAVTISVRDSAALLDISSGEEPGSPYAAPKPARKFMQEIASSPGKLKIALAIAPPSGVPVDAECKKAALETAKLCESLGHTVEEAAPQVDGAAMREAQVNVLAVSTAKTLEDAAKSLGRAVTENDVEPVTWYLYQQGLKTSGLQYARAIATFQQLGLQMAKFQQKYDIILSPTLAKPPVGLGILSLSPKDLLNYGKEVGEFAPHTALYNMTGQPSMSVPLYWSADGLPIGVMFSARFGDEATLLRLAAQLEQAKPWAKRRPKMLRKTVYQ